MGIDPGFTLYVLGDIIKVAQHLRALTGDSAGDELRDPINRIEPKTCPIGARRLELASMSRRSACLRSTLPYNALRGCDPN